jgi:hypothetical protein
MTVLPCLPLAFTETSCENRTLGELPSGPKIGDARLAQATTLSG